MCQQNKAQIESRKQYVSVSLCQTVNVLLQVCARENTYKLLYLARLQVSLPAFGHSPSGPQSLRMSCFHCKTERSGHQRRDETVWRRREKQASKGVNMISYILITGKQTFCLNLSHLQTSANSQSFPGSGVQLYLYMHV